MIPKTAAVARRLGFLAMALFCLDAYAQNITPGGDQSAPLRIPAIPYVLEARNAPAAIRVTGEGGLEIASGSKTNLFNNPINTIPLYHSSLGALEQSREVNISPQVGSWGRRHSQVSIPIPACCDHPPGGEARHPIHSPDGRASGIGQENPRAHGCLGIALGGAAGDKERRGQPRTFQQWRMVFKRPQSIETGDWRKNHQKDGRSGRENY